MASDTAPWLSAGWYGTAAAGLGEDDWRNALDTVHDGCGGQASTSLATSPPPASPGPFSAHLQTPASLPAASPIMRTASQSSAPSSMEAALATLRSPPRRTRRATTRASTAHSSDGVNAESALRSLQGAAPTTWRGPDFPSVLLRSVSDSSCPTQSSLAASLGPPANIATAPTSSPFLPGYVPPSGETDACGAPLDIVVEEPQRKVKRRSRKTEGYIPRPSNSFMLYRSAQLKQLSGLRTNSGGKLQQADLSRRIAAMWRDESAEVRERYVRQAADEKEAHARRYPDYAFRPKPSRRSSARGKLERTTEGPSADRTGGFALPSSPLRPSGLVGVYPLGELLPAINFSGHGSPISPSPSCDDFPTTPSTAATSAFDSYFVPPSTAASDAWAIFQSAPLVWMGPLDATHSQPSSLDFCPATQSAAATFATFDLQPLPPSWTHAGAAPLPPVTDATLLPPAPMSYEDLLASFPPAGFSTYDACATPVVAYSDNSLQLTTLPPPSSLSLPEHQARVPASPSGAEPFKTLFHTYTYPSP